MRFPAKPASELPILLALLLALACHPPAPSPPAEPLALSPGTTVSRTIHPGTPHRFAFPLPAGWFLHLEVDQRAVDVAVAVLDPAGRVLLEVDNAEGRKMPETVQVVAPATGGYTLRISAPAAAQAGEVRVTVRASRPAGPDDRRRAACTALLAQADHLRQAGDLKAAAAAWQEALPALEALGTAREVARVRWRLGVALTSTGDLREALGHLETSAATFRRLGDGVGEARVSNSLGAVWRYLGEPDRARAAYERALTLYRTADVLNGEASALNNLGLVDESTGVLQQALTRYEEALALWRRFGDRGAEAATLQNLGSLYVQIGHDAEGLALLRRALELAAGEPAASNEPARTSILISLGWAEALTGHPDQALERYREALTLARSTGDRLAEAAILDRQGSALKALGRFAKAEASYLRSLEISRGGAGGEGSPRNEGPTLANLGQLHLETGGAAGLDRAQGELERALALLQAAGDPSSEAVVRVALSRIERRRGAFGPARLQIDQALHRLEELRAGLRGPASRGIFQATRYDAWEELVTLLLEQGHASEALEVAERARARNLLDQIRDVVSPSPGGGRVGDGRGGQGVRTPRDEARPTGQSLSARQIQALADPGTLLVVFFLAEPASVAWTIDRDSLVVHTLPGRATLETLARRVAAAVPKSHEIAVHAAATRALRDLGTALFAPLAARLERHPRLVVLPDGALHLVPFCALPFGPDPSPLLLTHAIVLLPSATVLAEQRRRLAGRAPAPGTVAVLADPLFTAPGAAEERGDPALGFGPLPRLPYTADEARAIERLVPADRRLVALGAAASRDLVMGGALRRYRILHFATHGLLHPVLPERSGLVLTLFDAQGRPNNGFLAAPDVTGLDLPADLAVLSACQTGLGRELRGEGLVGLTHAFFRAGTKAVIVSGWNVRDRTTAALMERFYTNLLVRHQPPATALRHAQLALLRDPRTAAPSAWAGFALHGDWR